MKMVKMDLTKQTNYIKGGNEGSITYFPQQEKPFLAVTAVKSNWYKTQSGAEKFMAKAGYKRI